MDLRGRVAWVVGGGRGIGRACAERLAAAGAAVGVAARTVAEVEAVAAAIAARGGRAHAVVADVTDAASLAAALAAIEGVFGACDTVVNAAGIAASAPVARTDDALWGRLLAVNATGTFALLRATVPAMAARGFGRFIGVASVIGKVGAPYVGAYAASKHAVLGLLRSAALEWATTGVTVNAVCPGYVDTPMTDATVANIAAKTGRSAADARAALVAMNPQRRLVAPAEVAHLVAFLATREAGAINGQAINVDGGAVQS
jgi:NAD(P)-dependent dehydrogenase (short-subunit alcohol dehydrogenase family)